MYSLKGVKFSGCIENFPHPVVHEMMLQQELQDQPANHQIFEDDESASISDGAFDWADSTQGLDFWIQVIGNKDFKYFFDMKSNPTMQGKYAKYASASKSIEEVTKKVATKRSKVSKGDVVFVSDLNEEDALKYESKRVFLRTSELGNVCTDLNSWKNNNGSEEGLRTSTWVYVVPA